MTARYAGTEPPPLDPETHARMSRIVRERMEADPEFRASFVQAVGTAVWEAVHAGHATSDPACICQQPEEATR